jgi:putative transposase
LHDWYQVLICFIKTTLKSSIAKDIDQYYNSSRTHPGIDRQTPIISEKPGKTAIAETSLISGLVLNGLYHNYRKAA